MFIHWKLTKWRHTLHPVNKTDYKKQKEEQSIEYRLEFCSMKARLHIRLDARKRYGLTLTELHSDQWTLWTVMLLSHFSQIIRQGVYTDMNVVPILPPKKYDSSGRVCRLNSFALDFYKHGSSEAIVKENGWVFRLGYQPLFKRMRPNSYRTFLDFFGLSHALLLQDTWRSSKNIQAEGEGDGWNRTKWRSTVFWNFLFWPLISSLVLKVDFSQSLDFL